MSKPKLTVTQIRRRIARIPQSKRCSANCPCWTVSERDDTGELNVERCDDCVSQMDKRGKGLYLYDTDMRRLPEARRELARVKHYRETIAEAGGHVCCAVCGSMNVEYAVWFNPNTGKDGEMFGSWNAGDNTACSDCDSEGRDPNPPLVDAGADFEAFKAARAIRKKLDAGADPNELGLN